MFTVCRRGRDFRERAAAGAVTISGEALAAVAPTLPRWRGVYRRPDGKGGYFVRSRIVCSTG
jgi:hypothetical protein